MRQSPPLRPKKSFDRCGSNRSFLPGGQRTRTFTGVAIPEVLIGQVAEGDKVAVSFDALPGRTFKASVREAGVAATGAAPPTR